MEKKENHKELYSIIVHTIHWYIVGPKSNQMAVRKENAQKPTAFPDTH